MVSIGWYMGDLKGLLGGAGIETLHTLYLGVLWTLREVVAELWCGLDCMRGSGLFSNAFA